MNAVNEQAEACPLEELSKSEEILQTKDSTMRELEERFGTKIHDLESQLREKEEFLKSRDGELETLRTEIHAFAGQVNEMEALKERWLSEMDRLTYELHKRKLLLAKAETEEWRSIGRRNLWKRRLASLSIF